MMHVVDSSAVSPPPEPVTYLWDRVKEALAANGDPSPRQIDRMAAAAGVELAASTIEGWFKTWSVVPAWEKFDALIKALGAEHDEAWRSLHGAALRADRKRKQENRNRKDHWSSTPPPARSAARLHHRVGGPARSGSPPRPVAPPPSRPAATHR